MVKRTSHQRDGVTLHVWRDDNGQFHRAAPGREALSKLKAAARRMLDMEDRVGPPLRYGSAGVAGWWYMVKGPQRWVRRESRAGWHHGFYYEPKFWMPVVPPRDTWENSHMYSAPAGTPISTQVPAAVWQAAHFEPERITGKRAVGDSSARSEAFRDRAHRSGTNLDYPKAKGLAVRKVNKKPKRR